MKIFDKELFKKIRKEKKYSQQEIADVLHINRSYISQWESGSVTPSQEQVQQLEEYLNVSLYKQEKAQWPYLSMALPAQTVFLPFPSTCSSAAQDEGSSRQTPNKHREYAAASPASCRPQF